jgi:hypothetical protein
MKMKIVTNNITRIKKEIRKERMKEGRKAGLAIKLVN